MPGIDGLGVLQALREARIETPVVFLTMLGEEIYEEAALKWGAVDFIDKSRRLSIILQRLKLITDGPKLPGAGEAEARRAAVADFAHGAAGAAQRHPPRLLGRQAGRPP